MDITELLKLYVSKVNIAYVFSEEELSLIKEQSIQTLIYPVTHNKLYKKYYVSWVSKQKLFFNIQEELTNVFNSNNIKHIYFKGSVLAGSYDDSSVRTRDDIDLYVNSNDLDKAKNY